MGKYSIDEETLDAIAEGARNAIGTYDSMTPEEIAERLDDIYMTAANEDCDIDPYDEWVRPDGWPDIDTLLDNDSAEDVIYMTYDADKKSSALALYIETVSGTSLVEIGHVANNIFIADETATVARNTKYCRWMDDYDGLIVIRITGLLQCCLTTTWTDSGKTQLIGRTPIVQRAARIPHMTALDRSDRSNYRWCTFFLVRDRIENGNGESLVNLTAAWYYAISLRSLDISKLKTQNVTNISNAFVNCICLKFIDISHLNVSKVIDAHNVFESAISIRYINLDGCSFDKCTNFSYMFNKCRSLKRIDGLDNLITNVVTTISYMFSECASIECLDLSNWDTSGLQNVASAFYSCYAMKELIVPWHTPLLTKMNSAFAYCRCLKHLDISTWDLSKITTFASAFAGDKALRSIKFPNTTNKVAISVTQMFQECYSLCSVDISWLKLTNKCNNICRMFQECLSFSSIDIPEWDLTGISNDNTPASYVFAYCRSLKRINGIKKWTFTHTNTIDSMFIGCIALEEIDVSEWDISTVRSISNMFSECYSLKELDLSSWRPRNESVDLSGVFAYCHSLRTIGDISEWRPQPNSIYRMFYECFSLKEFPDIRQWDMSVCTSAEGAFNSCRSFVTVNIHGLNLPQCTKITSMFYQCYNLKMLDAGELYLPALTTAPSTFAADCYALEDLIPPSFSLNHSYVNDYSLTHESAIRILEALPEVNAARTVNLNSWILQSLSPEEKKIATDKGWTLAN